MSELEDPVGSTMSEQQPAPAPVPRRRSRRSLARAVMWLLPVVAVAIGLWVYLASGRYVGTDNAYVKGDRVLVAPEIAGVVIEVLVQENQPVTKGQLLFRLDDSPYKLALAKAEAELESAIAEIQGLRASWRQKREEVKLSGSQENFAQIEFDRQSDLAQRKIGLGKSMDEARRDIDVARQRTAMLKEELLRIEAALAGDPKIKAEDHPKVRQIKAMRDEAILNLKRTRIESPIAGIAARKPVVGAYASAGTAMMTVVSDTGLWIEANYKETDLARVRPGQRVSFQVDTYPDRTWHGVVTSISQATGAEFAVLPPQNASGNWVKVVQRIPVRIEVRTTDSDPPLRVGMSVSVDIDTGYKRSFGDLVASVERLFGLGGANAQTGAAGGK
ncbi:MAG: HlyD family secretion protein [Alphaproteobacteria bacterium]|nr:HlyD family secretion protein [Alphaproteobacteria bacterium]